MKKSNWRKEIINEFVQSGNPIVGGAVAGQKVGKFLDKFITPKLNPLPKYAPFTPPKYEKTTDGYTKLYTDKELETKKKAFTPTDPGIKGFTPSKEIEKERERLIKQRENEKKEKERGETDNKRGTILTPDKKEIDKLTPKKIDTNPVETPNKEKETENPEPEKEKDDNKKKIKKITKIKNNNIDKNKQKNDQKIKDSQKNKDKKTIAVPLPFKIKNKTTRRVPPVGGLSK